MESFTIVRYNNVITGSYATKVKMIRLLKFAKLLPLNSTWRFTCNIVDHSGNTRHFIGNPI